MAQKSVLRYYRIKTPVVVPGYAGPLGNVVARLEQLLPIEDEQVVVAQENGQPANRAAVVFGVWHPDPLNVANSATSLAPLEDLPAGEQPGRSLYRRPFMVDAARGLVIFDEPVYRNAHISAGGGLGFELQIAPAQLVLRTACSVRDAKSLAPARYDRQRDSGENHGTAPRYLPHDELLLVHKPRYAKTYAIAEVESNQAELDAIADDYIDAAEREYQLTLPRSARYAGLVPIEPDGAIVQISYQVGGSGATTIAARNNELPRLGRSLQARRRLERARTFASVVEKLGERGLARAIKSNPHVRPRKSL